MGEIAMDVATREGKYIYCIIDSDGPKSFGPLGIGGRGDLLHSVCFKDISAVVSDAPIQKYRVSRDNSLSHERAIEAAMIDYTVLPVRFATVAENEEKVRRILEKDHDKFKDLLTGVRGKTELSVKALFKEQMIYAQILEDYPQIRALKEKTALLPPDKAHFHLMEIGERVEKALCQEKESLRDAILAVLSPMAVEVKTNNLYGDMMIINAAFFVEKAREAEFDQAVQTLDSTYSQSVIFKYVGTLPPFNFVNIQINTEDY